MIPISILSQKVSAKLILLPILSCTFIGGGGELSNRIHCLWNKDAHLIAATSGEVIYLAMCGGAGPRKLFLVL